MHMEQSAYWENVRAVLDKNRTTRFVSMKALKKNVENISHYIKSGYEKVQNINENINSEAKQLCEWLSDNRYVFEENISIVEKSLFKKKLLSGGKANKPIYYHAFCEFYKCFDGKLSEERIMEFCSIVMQENQKPTYFDLYSFESIMRVVILESVGDVCKKICEETYDENCESELRKAVLSLKKLSSFDIEKIFEISPAERILTLDPAGAYSKMTKQTKREYRESLYKKAREKKKSEDRLAFEIVERCKKAKREREKHVGFYLLEENKSVGNAYFVSLFSFILLTISALLCIHPIMILCLFPIWELYDVILHRLFDAFSKKRNVPSLEISSVPETSAVICVITSLLVGGKSDKEIFSRLEKMYISNGGKNIYFGILADRTDSESLVSKKDEEILTKAKECVKELRKKYGDVFFLFSRERKYSLTQKKFMAYERKRGAVNALCAYLCNKSDEFDEYSIKPDKNLCQSIKYCITLDADTNLPLGSVLKMTGAMLHPLNKPEINYEKHIVTNGYGIMQPKISTTLFSAGRTRFSRIMCGVGGTEIYSSASFDLEQSIFSNAVFCGKGIFDKHAFYEVTSGNAAFESDKILSHDALEGARLRCALLCDVTLTDNFPKNELSYFKRAHRWIRGDVQNLTFLSKYVRNDEGQRIQNSISAIYKYRIFDNFRRALVPVFSVLCVVCGMFLGKEVATILIVAGLLHIFAHPILDLVSCFFNPSILQLLTRRFYSNGIKTGLWHTLERSLYVLCGLCKNAIVSLDAFLRSLFRMFVSKKNMLEWVTAAQTDEADKDGILGYVWKNLPSAVLGVALFAFSPGGLARVIGLLWFFHPALSFYTSLASERKNRAFSEKDKRIIKEYAYDTWKFFEENVDESENFLPIDNIQFFPDTMKAHRTSPTNIGLYLVCVLCARDFGFIDTQSMLTRLSNTLTTLEKMEKWHGHLYNWYDTNTLKVLYPRFVSGVDSGNFLACLILVAQGVREYEHECKELEKVRERLEELCDGTELLPIYDEENELFYIGVNVDENGKATYSDNKYDLLMSEARTLSYIACARRNVPASHWQKLSRMPVKSCDRMGLASWTGTAFEYFMPAIFLPVYEGSLSYEALCFALSEQKKRVERYDGIFVWGISESAFFAFDYEMNYQYRAFGIPSLALHRGLENDHVISPYSTFLSMCICSKCALSNLEKLKKIGLYGKYGFYESADFTKRRVKKDFAKIKSVMSHHAGMSMASCANAYFDNILQKRFMSNKKMLCAKELLEEKIQASAVITKNEQVPERENRPDRRRDNGFRNFENTQIKEPVCSMLSDGKSKILLSSKGFAELSYGDIIINRASADESMFSSLFLLCEINKEVFSTSFYDLNKEGIKYSFGNGFGKTKSSVSFFTRDKKKYVFCVEFSIDCVTGSVFRIKTSLKGTTKKQCTGIKFAICFEPVLNTKSAYEAHPAFSSLFVASEYDEKEKMLIFSRRKREEKDKECFLAISTNDEVQFEFATRKNVLSPFPVTIDSIKNVFNTDLSEKQVGACINPYCVVRTQAVSDKNQAEFIIGFANDKESACSKVALSKSKRFEECSGELYEKALHMVLSTRFFPSYENEISEEEKMLSACIYPEKTKTMYGKQHEMDSLWKHGISGDVPIFVAFADTAYLCEKLEKYVRAFLLLRLKGLKSEFAILCSDTDSYHQKGQNRIRKMLEENSALGLVEKKCGIFIVNINTLSDKGQAILSCASLFIKQSVPITLEKIQKRELDVVRKSQTEITNISDDVFFSGAGGFYKDNSYITQKSKAKRVYAQVLSGRLLSTVVDINSLGYTFCRNAAERRITPFYNDDALMQSAEHIYAEKNGKLYDLCALSESFCVFPGYAVYKGKVLGDDYTITVFVPEKLPVKIVAVNTGMRARLMFTVKPIMGREQRENMRVNFEVGAGCTTFFNMFPKMYGETGFVFGYKLDEQYNFAELSQTDFDFSQNNFKTARAFFDIDEQHDGIYVFALGSANSTQTLDFIMKNVRNNYKDIEKSAKDFSRSFLNYTTLCDESDSVCRSLSIMFDTWLPYQNGVCRFFARSGFYQSGGAFGFRDQLQDSLGLMFSHPEITRTHIIRSCAHQFEEGDVLHWYHMCSQGKDHSHSGVRTKISDDYIFLPYVVSEYVSFSGDVSLLDVPVRYISAPLLSEEEHEKYITPTHSNICESVYRHCLRALARACEKVGERGLCLIGSGDWCDGLNRIGLEGKGESVWLTMFLCNTLEKFSKVCKMYDDSRSALIMSERRKKLMQNIENHAFDYESGYYIRAYTDDGRKIGTVSEKENAIELLPQAFAVIAQVGDTGRRVDALNKAFDTLYDKENHIMKLFTPSYNNPEYDPGYIKGYCKGLRENGGQYTHAAVWMMSALFKLSMEKDVDKHQRKELLEKGVMLFKDMLVPYRMRNEQLSVKYKAEPYVLSADIYSNEEHEGLAGWTWYTGSASWLWREILSCVFCMSFEGMKTDFPTLNFTENVFIVPFMLEGLNGVKIKIEESLIVVKYEKRGQERILHDGKDTGMKIKLQKGENEIVVWSK